MAVVIEDALQGELLRATQAEFKLGAELMRPLWEQAKRAGEPLSGIEGYGPMTNVPAEWFDIPKYAELGPASLSTMDNPKNMELLTSIVGDDLALSQVCPPSTMRICARLQAQHTKAPWPRLAG
jgi:hypothetical protein